MSWRMTIDQTAADIRDEFAFLEDWEMRYAHLIDLGRANHPLREEERCEANRVRGCASQVWLVQDGDSGTDRLTLRGESDAMIVSGLVALLTRLFSGHRPEDILAFDTRAFLDEIGVAGAITAQRANGLASMLARIREFATTLQSPEASGGNQRS